MDPGMEQKLLSAGVDVPGALRRFSNNDALFIRFLREFPNDPSFSELADAMNSANRSAAIDAAHTLKGVGGNLGFSSLFEAASKLVSLLRENEDAEHVQAAYARLTEEIQKIVACIRSL